MGISAGIQNVIAGKNWFKNMKTKFKEDFLVYSDDEKDPVFSDQQDLHGWCEKKQKHIIKHNNLELLDSRNRVFVLEMQTYQFDAEKTVRIVVSNKTLEFF